jgi:DNA replication licensing factor MCM6
MSIMQKVVYHLADVEREKNTGLPRSEVVQWYLEEVENEITSVEQLEQETLLIDKVLTKLVKVRSLSLPLPGLSLTMMNLQEKYLLELRGEGLQAGQGETDEDIDPVHAEPEAILSIHPELDYET